MLIVVDNCPTKIPLFVPHGFQKIKIMLYGYKYNRSKQLLGNIIYISQQGQLIFTYLKGNPVRTIIMTIFSISTND